MASVKRASLQTAGISIYIPALYLQLGCRAGQRARSGGNGGAEAGGNGAAEAGALADAEAELARVRVELRDAGMRAGPALYGCQ